MNVVKANGYARISKVAARRRYNEGRTVYIAPVKLTPGGPWGCTMALHGCANGDAFDKLVDAFQFYNCSGEVGRYPAFYVRANEQVSSQPIPRGLPMVETSKGVDYEP